VDFGQRGADYRRPSIICRRLVKTNQQQQNLVDGKRYSLRLHRRGGRAKRSIWISGLNESTVERKKRTHQQNARKEDVALYPGWWGGESGGQGGIAELSKAAPTHVPEQEERRLSVISKRRKQGMCKGE